MRTRSCSHPHPPAQKAHAIASPSPAVPAPCLPPPARRANPVPHMGVARSPVGSPGPVPFLPPARPVEPVPHQGRSAVPPWAAPARTRRNRSGEPTAMAGLGLMHRAGGSLMRLKGGTARTFRNARPPAGFSRVQISARVFTPGRPRARTPPCDRTVREAAGRCHPPLKCSAPPRLRAPVPSTLNPQPAADPYTPSSPA
jgi:hypothetical protein